MCWCGQIGCDGQHHGVVGGGGSLAEPGDIKGLEPTGIAARAVEQNLPAILPEDVAGRLAALEKWATKQDIRRRYCELMTKSKAEFDQGRFLSPAEAAEFSELAKAWAHLSIEEGA